MERAACISCSPVKTLKSSEQSSVEYSHASHARSYLISAEPALLPYPTACSWYSLSAQCRQGVIPRSQRAPWPKGFLMPSFHAFFLQPATPAVLAIMEITEPTPVQAEAIPTLLAGT